MFKPLLAATCDDLSKLRFPLLASPKLDGIRCVKLDGKALTRKLKNVPNDYVRSWVETNLPDGIDGELMLRDHKAPFSDVSSAIMSKKGEPDFVFMAFDYRGSCDEELGFQDRFENLKDWIGPGAHHLALVPHERVEGLDELQAVVARHLDASYEGTMLRCPEGRYKFGRSTLKEGILLKVKPFQDLTATIVGVVEQMHNTNEAARDALGNVKRSSAKAGKIGKGILGALECVTEDGAEFEVGTGFTEMDRVALWKRKEHLIGVQVDVKHQPPPGGREEGSAPRFPVFLRFRHASDC